LNQLLQTARVEAEVLPKHIDDELRARTVSGIVKLLPAVIGAKVEFVLAAQERALVMIEPPREARIARVLEIQDGIFVAIELDIKEQLPGTMCQPLILELGVRADCIEIEVGEYGCGRQTIEAVVVKEYLHPHKALNSKRACKIFMISWVAGKNATHYHTPYWGASLTHRQ
jgi:hypothetical protein